MTNHFGYYNSKDLIQDFRALTKHAKKELPEDSPEVKVAILGDHATQFFAKAVEASFKLSGLNLKLFEADYDQIDITLIDKSSGFNEFEPNYVIIFESALKLRSTFNGMDSEERSNFANQKIEQFKNRLNLISAGAPSSKLLSFNLEFLNTDVFGNYFPNVPASFSFQLNELNYQMTKLSSNHPHFHLLDLNRILLPLAEYRDNRLYISSDLHYSMDTYGILAQHVTKTINSLEARFKKCLILDLDNTTWGGIIGDDGLDQIEIGSLGIGKAFSNLQKWAKELKKRGVILAVCSKNNEAIAKEPFEKHEEMVLRLEDISVFVANWENKADNIRYIQEVLNIGLDSMVFLDDNPAEREIIRQSLPQVTVPELPEDPVNYLPYLNTLNLFETTSYSENDQDRTQQYQQEAERKKSIAQVTNMDDYLSSLEMTAEIQPFLDDDISRIAQLTQRSNQFNLRTIRYDEESIRNIQKSNDHETYTLKLTDKFGPYGLVSVVILEKKSDSDYFINTWIMSCRVLKRGVEHLIMNCIVEDLEEKGVNKISGEYIKTPKNNLVSNLLDGLGFSKEGEDYSLRVKDYSELKHFIS